MATENKLANANDVAAFLKVSVTCVYALVNGVRGWGRIEKLPALATGKGKERPRYSFDMDAVRAWKARNKFERQSAGRKAPVKRVTLQNA